MNREKDFVKNTIILGMGNLFPKIAVFITLPVLTLKLSKWEYGMYDLIMAGVSFLLPLITLQMQSAAFRFLIECRNDTLRTKQIISNIVTMVYTISFLTCFFVIAALGTYSWLLRVGIGTYFFSDMMYMTMGQIIRGMGYNRQYSIAALILACIQVFGILIMTGICQKGLLGIICVLALANLLSAVYMSGYIKVWKMVCLRYISPLVTAELIKYSFPMIFNNLAMWVLNLSDRVILNYFLGLEATAVYAVANKIPGMISFAQSIMTMAWQENASLAVTDKDAKDYFSRMFKNCFDILFVITVLLFMLLPILFCILIQGDYKEAYPNISILMLGMFFYVMSSFLGGIYVAHKKTKAVAGSAFLAAFLNLFLNILLIENYGVTAATLSTLCACMALYIGRAVKMKKIQKIDYHVIHQVQLVGILIVMVIIGHQLSMSRFVINLILGMAAIWMQRKTFAGIYIKIWRKGTRKNENTQ